jgi:hypothetical protein
VEGSGRGLFYNVPKGNEGNHEKSVRILGRMTKTFNQEPPKYETKD